MSSDNINEDTFMSLMGEKQATLDDIKFVPDSPLSSENWNFYSTAGLLEYEQVQTVAGRIAHFNEENSEIAFTDEVIEQFLFGVGSHHAGMLPAHKAFVELLFRANLIKACFATETLAAGINMPARTTVVCAMAKRDGSRSMSLLETSNMLQMAGRAGRRGMDLAGTCVVSRNDFAEYENTLSNVLLTFSFPPDCSHSFREP
jgi:superfamily II RNA helicase